MKQLTMIVPMYNDQESLNFLTQIIEGQSQTQIQYLVVDNGSKFNLTLPQSDTNKIKLIRLPANIGFGGGILEGAKAANTEWIGWMPGNLKVSPLDIPEIMEIFDFGSSSLLKCHRKNRPLSARVKTLIAGTIQSLICRTNMLDTGGTPTVCEKSFLLSLGNPPLDYVFESYILFRARKQKMKVVRPTIHYGPRLFGTSHWQSGLMAELRLMKAIVQGRKHWD